MPLAYPSVTGEEAVAIARRDDHESSCCFSDVKIVQQASRC